MTEKLTRWLWAIIAMALTLIMLCGTLGAFRGMSASAADVEPATPGWYVMGNGAGTTPGVGLRPCSWTEYKSDYKLTGTPATEGETPANYLGSWNTAKLALYVNDQFKFLYADGTLAGPDDDSWGTGFVGGFYEIPEAMRANFWDGGLGNIQIKAEYEGWYTFYVRVYELNGQVSISVAYVYDNTTPLPEIEKEYQMYVVGHIASIPDLGWPGEVTETGEERDYTLAPMEAYYVTEDGERVIKYYSEAIVFAVTDEVKLYNDVNNSYYPSGVDNNKSPETAGTYYVEWKQDAPDFLFVLEMPVDAEPVPTPEPEPGPEPEPPQPTYPTAGWYLVGNGAGTLYDCSWTEYLSDYRIGGTAFDGSTEKDYLGFWKTESLLLYQGDQFKFLYQNGKWATPDASGWLSSYTAGFADLSANNSGDAFSSVGEDIIQVNKSGYYTFYIHVAKSTSGVAITLTFNLTSTSVPSKTLEDMYIVGSIASVPACGWPDDVNVASSCIKMTHNSYDNKWYSPAIRLTTTDEIKVYNLSNHGYYPSFFDDNFSVATSGWYIIQWESGSQTLTAIPVPNDFAN